jgi:hypothetical protein
MTSNMCLFKGKGAISLKTRFEGGETIDGWCFSLVSCDLKFGLVHSMCSVVQVVIETEILSPLL